MTDGCAHDWTLVAVYGEIHVYECARCGRRWYRGKLVFRYAWIGGRVPRRIEIPQYRINIDVRYMRDGMIQDAQGKLAATYVRIIDYVKQSDGTFANEIELTVYADTD